MANQKERQKKLLLVLGAAVILIVIVLYFGFLRGDDTSNIIDSFGNLIPSGSVSSSEFINEADIKFISAINLDLEFLKSGDFVSLDINGDIPIKPQTAGRTNPFVPY